MWQLDVVIQNKGAFPYMGIRILPINLSFFGSIPKKIIYGCPEDDYLPDMLLFGWVVVYKIPYRRARAWPSASREQRYLAYKMGGSIIKCSSRLRPFTGTAVARSAECVETPKLQQQLSLYGWGFSVNPISKPNLIKKVG